ncbi:hypothetical protein ABZ568_09915 [Streptomyces olindensis]|uniref:Uncharacterized protein n=1 Tax=Streptomyces olindensis TaxID=358823 RepID=A0ABV2XRU7_9ACTN
MERIARECGLAPAELIAVLDRLTRRFIGWHVASGSGDLHWELLPEASVAADRRAMWRQGELQEQRENGNLTLDGIGLPLK